MSSSNYLSEVVNLFLTRRSSTLNLSPLDWQIVAAWEKQGIPLHIVIRAINGVFDKYYMQPKAKQKPIKSISYCSEEIQIAFENWLQLQVGK